MIDEPSATDKRGSDDSSKPDGDTGESSSPTKVQDLTRAGEDIDPNEGQE